MIEWMSGDIPKLAHRVLCSEDAYFEDVQGPIQPSIAAWSNSETGAPTTITAPLTNVADIVRLSNEEAGSGIPVRLHGVLTDADTEWRSGFIQDETGGIYVNLAQTNVQAGQWVELVGQTERGGFNPQVISASILVIGQTNYPAPARVDPADIALGGLDACWVQMEGVVQQVRLEWGHVYISIMGHKGRFDLLMSGFQDRMAPHYLIDALVRVQGACGLSLTARRQISGITLHVPSLSQIEVVEPAPSDPFAASAVPIAGVGTFDPKRLAGRRIKIAGTVTMVLPGRGFYLQDATAGICAIMQQTNSLQTGDRVEVLGFPAINEFAPCIQGTTFRRIDRGPFPAAKQTSAEQILSQQTNDAMFVEIQARLLQDAPRSTRPRLILQDSTTATFGTCARRGDGLECLA